MSNISFRRVQVFFNKYVDLAVVLIILFVIVYAFLIVSSQSLFSYFIFFAMAFMITGQLLLVTSFGQTYFFYFYSFSLTISISLIFWMALNSSFIDYTGYVLYFLALI
jgi:hypothetical protein